MVKLAWPCKGHLSFILEHINSQAITPQWLPSAGVCANFGHIHDSVFVCLKGRVGLYTM